MEFDLQRRMVAGEILDVSTFLESRISVSAGSDFFQKMAKDDFMLC